MAQAVRKTKDRALKPERRLWGNQLQIRLREGIFVFLCGVAVFFLASLLSYSPMDPGWTHEALSEHIQNACGWVGAWFADISLVLLGYLAYALPLMLAYSGWTVFHDWREIADTHHYLLLVRVFGFLLICIAGTGLMHIHFPELGQTFPVGSGGALGNEVSGLLIGLLNAQGATLILLALGLMGITLSTGLSWLKVMDSSGHWLLLGWRKLIMGWEWVLSKGYEWYEERQDRKLLALELQLEDALAEDEEEEIKPRKVRAKQQARLPRPEEVAEEDEEEEKNLPVAKPAKPIIKTVQKPVQKPRIIDVSAQGLPSLDLLELPPTTEQESQYTPAELEQMSREVENRLADFHVEARVVAVLPGPVITRFELELAPGIKVSKITGLAKDLARSLSMISVRVVEVIPGKPYVGLELPNRHRETVTLREGIASDEYDKLQSPVSLALGKDIAGHPVVVDLAKMPHLLVAGTTGSGKSVGVNSMLLSILFKSTPDEVRLILIDPKMLELSIYEGIPHLLCPVVVDMKEAYNALAWCVAEMERRYRLMAALGVRNMAGFNRKVRDAITAGKPIRDPLVNVPGELPPELTTLSYIVVVIDEFADMMMVVGKKVEELIARIAQKARAAGIHLILATQRPSVDVITGLIKANIPTRIAFQVASRIDSRTILDQQGAEQLLGRGDMLYLPAGGGVPIRVHGAFVADQEVHSVVNDWKSKAQPQYDESILNGGPRHESAGLFGLSGDEDNQADPLYDQAVRIVTETRRPSISNIQRRLKIGYNRAARLMEEMEGAGIVSPMQANGNREVLVSAPPSVEEYD